MHRQQAQHHFEQLKREQIYNRTITIKNKDYNLYREWDDNKWKVWIGRKVIIAPTAELLESKLRAKYDLKAKATFNIESLFEGKDYVGVYDQKTGNLIKHIYNGEEFIHTEKEEIKEPEVKNPNQLKLF